MSRSNRKISLTKDFKHFVMYHTDLSREDQDYVIRLFDHDHIKITVRISLILLIWAFFATFLDSVLFSSGVVTTAMNGFSILNFLPSLVFLISNIVAKLVFIQWFDSEKCLDKFQRFLASLPSVGVILFLSSVFKKEKEFLKTLRSYFRFTRKRGLRFIVDLLNLRGL